LRWLPSDICRKRSYDRPCVHAAPARLRHQELFSILTGRHFRTQAIERRIGTDFDLDTFNLTAVIAGLTNDLRELTFGSPGAGRGLSDSGRRTDHQKQEDKCQLRPPRHLCLLFEKSAQARYGPRRAKFHAMALNAFPIRVMSLRNGVPDRLFRQGANFSES